MPALKPTSYAAEVVWLGRVANSDHNLSADAVEGLDLTFGGDVLEFHSGVTRQSCVRVKALYERGTEIMNVRQLSVVSQEELDQIAEIMGVDQVDPAMLGASIVVRGLPDLTHVPPNSRLQGPSGATITIDMENRPCEFPGRVIEETYPGLGHKFKSAAKGRRGVTAWVECAGRLSVGDCMRLFIPDQPRWAHMESVRSR
ncbi:MOSC domain-containing protein [Shimia marina]|uniref:Putative metal-sulfur cluster biosynthesis proteins YuaD n=1 Tax=Shimia marina TaxID=321267 RepID=A0A0P1EP33_9RHOB|nr:MOSC domain-containing protein [Shimia marina]CUH52063.1 Putative metal-sulfur cluster biosynthesis proteins YuaD [Shimia marina]SFE60585.1 MOSC domain [Shimia marina]